MQQKTIRATKWLELWWKTCTNIMKESLFSQFNVVIAAVETAFDPIFTWNNNNGCFQYAFVLILMVGKKAMILHWRFFLSFHWHIKMNAYLWSKWIVWHRNSSNASEHVFMAFGDVENCFLMSDWAKQTKIRIN